jgi:hypothetical protein
MGARQAEEMASCTSEEERSQMGTKHAAEKERIAKRIRGFEVQSSNEKMSATRRSGAVPSKRVCDVRTKSDIEAMVAKHPMMLKMASDLNQMRASEAKACATERVDNAIREGCLVPSQRDWAIEYCSSDPGGFQKFIRSQPRILQSGPDGTFTGRIGEAPADQLNQKELMVCERLGVTAEKFAAAKKARLSYSVHLD